MNQWNIYETLKKTRDGQFGTQMMQDQDDINFINKGICSRDIRNMDAAEIKEGIITYLATILPEFE